MPIRTIGFNPRARAGRDGLTADQGFRDGVSIHAPVRGATRAERQLSAEARSFNPRARAGRDSPSCRDRPASRSFNPRARAGRDIAQQAGPHGLDVSIHAPVRGATAGPGWIGPALGFQSTRPCGARPDSSHSSASPGCFNPRARAGRDPTRRAGVFSRCGFNPRARAGRDPPCAQPVVRPASFNPRARAGRDQKGQELSRWSKQCFNPRARAGRDSKGSTPSEAIPSFNPRARAGRDHIEMHQKIERKSFNPRARAGRDHSPGQGRHRYPCFNPRARAGRDLSWRLNSELLSKFQSTRPCGARLEVEERCRANSGCFNPRARAGRDW